MCSGSEMSLEDRQAACSEWLRGESRRQSGSVQWLRVESRKQAGNMQ